MKYIEMYDKQYILKELEVILKIGYSFAMLEKLVSRVYL
jgi:hypothetical protein